MTRLIGAALIAGGCGVMGLLAARQLARRVAVLEAWLSVLEMMGAELECRMTSVPDLANRMAAAAPAILRPSLSTLAAALKEPGDRRYADVWRMQVQGFALAAEEKQVLAELGQALGQFELAGQRRVLEGCRKQLSMILEQAREKREKLGRLYSMGGILCGLAVVVIFL